MPRSKRTSKTVETLRHEDASRKNIPTAEYQAVMAEDDRNPIKVAYERRNRDLDSQLVGFNRLIEQLMLVGDRG